MGRDNLVRSVDVKTQSSQLTQPVDKLYLLEAVANQYRSLCADFDSSILVLPGQLALSELIVIS